ncbi:disease resistance protein RPP2B-like [Neltuma alba]|uniref:disease resistance protein RPP2B-like n=1 Tax=Neltuma alba TaxID=207710 RepID=UPI0010A497B0|nr:disease resistance protein RPP2B-like [Prosopis alba]
MRLDLKISYDCLQDGAKRVFLDIACFFKRKTLEFIEDILEACDDGARFYIEILVDKFFITNDEVNKRLYMHDLIQQMAKEIGNDNIEGIILDPPYQEEVVWDGIAFEKMNNLKILIIRNTQFLASPKYFPKSLRLLDWKGFPSTTLPPAFSPSKLICLKLYGSHFRLEKPFKLSFKCNFIDFLVFGPLDWISHDHRVQAKVAGTRLSLHNTV